jgi:hypothetical protein
MKIRTATGHPSIPCQNYGCYHAGSGGLNKGRKPEEAAEAVVCISTLSVPMGVTLTGALFQAESRILGAGRPGKLLCEIPHPADLRRVGAGAFRGRLSREG